MRCDEAQGYFMAKPMPGAGFAAWIGAWQAPQTEFAALI